MFKFTSDRKQAEKLMNEAIKLALPKVAIAAKTKAVLLTPVDTGALRRSINFKVKGNRITLGSNLEYAMFVEYGTRFQAPQPFIKPAIDDVKVYKSIVTKCIEEVMK